MPVISHEHRILFVHIPKTGGSSIELFFTGYDWITASAEEYAIYLAERGRYREDWGGTLCEGTPDYFSRRLLEKHKTQSELQAEVGALWGDYTTFTFVRNPWVRLRSIYDHGRRDGPEKMPPAFRDWILEDEPLDHMGQAVFREWVHDWDAFDFVGRFEHLGRDFARLLERIGLDPAAPLPHEAHGGNRRHAADGWDAAARERVAARCAAEIARFGHRFEDALALAAA